MSDVGVYLITCTANGRRYVGSSSQLTRRWAIHRSLLRGGKHHNAIMQGSWSKHGHESFRFGVLEHVATAHLLVVEQVFIDYYRRLGGLMNLMPQAGRPVGYKHTDEAKEKISARNKANTRATMLKRRYMETRKTPIDRIGADGTITEYDSIAGATRDGFSGGNIHGCLTGRTERYRGFFWCRR